MTMVVICGSAIVAFLLFVLDSAGNLLTHDDDKKVDEIIQKRKIEMKHRSWNTNNNSWTTNKNSILMFSSVSNKNNELLSMSCQHSKFLLHLTVDTKDALSLPNEPTPIKFNVDGQDRSFYVYGSRQRETPLLTTLVLSVSPDYLFNQDSSMIARSLAGKNTVNINFLNEKFESYGADFKFSLIGYDESLKKQRKLCNF